MLFRSDKLDYAFQDGEVIGGKVYTTGVVEIDLDSLSQIGFKNNQKSPEQMALQELRDLTLAEEEIDEEMNDDDDYEDEPMPTPIIQRNDGVEKLSINFNDNPLRQDSRREPPPAKVDETFIQGGEIKDDLSI